jgi:thymidylate synthase
MINSFPNKTLYEFDIQRPKFSTHFFDFDNELQRWFRIEEKMRTQMDSNLFYEIQQVPDSFLRNSLEMLYIYNQYLNECPKTKIAELVEQLPTNDFKIAAIEYFSRTNNLIEQINLCEKEKDFFDFYDNQKVSQTIEAYVAASAT